MTARDEARLMAEVRETRLLVEAVLACKIGKEQAHDFVRSVKWHLDADPFDAQVPLWSIGLNTHYSSLHHAGYRTLGELARMPRNQIAAMPGIGRVSMGKIDAAMAEHGLSWGVAS